jgi:hypothetical protein
MYQGILDHPAKSVFLPNRVAKYLGENWVNNIEHPGDQFLIPPPPKFIIGLRNESYI